MSYFTVVDGQIMFFNTYCMSESIVDTPTEFGNNAEANNGKTSTVHTVDGPVHYAMFKHKDGHHTVTVSPRTGEIGMGSSDKPSTDVREYSDSFKNSRSDAIGVFGKSMHVLRHLTNKHNVKNIHFNGSHEKLSKVYDNVVKNKHFIKSMSDHGWTYDGKKDGDHHFSRK